jgi:tetratricopeptide (TPR) repeat protein
VIASIIIRVFFAGKRVIAEFNIKKSVLVTCIFFISISSYGQPAKQDSLRERLKLAGNYEEKFRITTQLSQLTAGSDPTLSLKYAEEAMQLANKTRSDTSLSKAKITLASACLRIGNYPQAVQLYQEIIENKDSNPDAILAAYMDIGIIYYYERNFKTAISYYNKALDLIDKRRLEKDKKKTIIEGKLNNNLGIIHEELKEFDKAEAFYNKALDISKQSNDLNLMAHVLTNQGRLYHRQGKNNLTLRLYLEALGIRKRNNDNTGLCQIYTNLGAFYFEQLKDYRVAEAYLKHAISLGQHIGDLLDAHLASDYLYKLYSQQDRYKEAFDALQLNKQLSDTLFNTQKTNKITQLEMQFQFDLKKIELDAKQREKDLYFLLVAIGLGLSLIIVILLFILQRNKARNSILEQSHLKMEKNSLEKDIELKNKQLTTNILYLMQKNELIDDISEQLLKIKREVGEESQPAVQKVVMNLQANLRPEILQEFEVRFQQVHENFFAALNEKFPNISPSERRLCAFLKLNMTTKEIAAITHQNIKSIEIARARLRKKLNLTGTDQNLIMFLSQLG